MLFVLLGLFLFSGCKEEKKEGPSPEEKAKKATEICMQDKTALKDPVACKSCCKKNEAPFYEFSGQVGDQAPSCTCKAQ